MRQMKVEPSIHEVGTMLGSVVRLTARRPMHMTPSAAGVNTIPPQHLSS